ncbi:MAG: helix-turn-helix domain-containing protein [Oscillospiraceae bacterium]|jgi:transcriptional regulator with XRE-family HTH domain|nr:helix-turn-helix domain-containing protein [Oscillospiraceae bacterium]
MSKSTKISKINEFRYIQIGLNVSYYRKLQGYTQEEFAEVADMSRSHLSALEAPNIVRSVSIELLFNIADALKIEPYRLLEFRN